MTKLKEIKVSRRRKYYFEAHLHFDDGRILKLSFEKQAPSSDVAKLLFIYANQLKDW